MASRCLKTLLAATVVLCATPLFAGVVPPIDVSNGSAFTVHFNGLAGFPIPTELPALSATVRFSDFVFSDVVGSDTTQVTFRADVSNTSQAPLTSSFISAFGFDTNPTILTFDDHNVTGAFDHVNTRGFIPAIGRVEFCLSEEKSCEGNGSIGINQGTTETAYATLYFAGAGLTELTIEGLSIRYQGLTGVPEMFNGVGSPVPEPVAFVVLAAGIGLIALRPTLYRRRSSEA
jgi:hypothetical protein